MIQKRKMGFIAIIPFLIAAVSFATGAHAASGNDRSEHKREFLITMTVTVPPGTPPQQVDDTLSREAQSARELAAQGHLLRLWSLPAAPGIRRILGLWRAGSSAEIAGIVDALPLRPWMTVETIPLTPHPNDPTGR